MQDSEKVSIIIVTWNSREYILDCLQSIIRNSPGLNHEIIVVDNGSSDGTKDIIAEHHPKIRLIDAGANLGFARAANMGCRFAKGSLLLLLNPDTRVEPGAIREMADVLARIPDTGCVGARLLDTDGRDLGTNTKLFPSLSLTLYRQFGLSKILSEHAVFGRDRIEVISGKRILRRQCIGGAAMLFPRTLFMALGGLDETIPLYLEDMDICKKVQNSGKSICMAHDAHIVHHCAKSADVSPIRLRLFALEKGHAPWLYMRRYNGRAQAAVFRAAILAGSLLRIALARVVLHAAPLLPPESRMTLSRVSTQSVALLNWALDPGCLLRSIEPHFHPGGDAGPISRD